jgi:hypothetical protein
MSVLIALFGRQLTPMPLMVFEQSGMNYESQVLQRHEITRMRSNQIIVER